jgi:hypothetical protein
MLGFIPVAGVVRPPYIDMPGMKMITTENAENAERRREIQREIGGCGEIGG